MIVIGLLELSIYMLLLLVLSREDDSTSSTLLMRCLYATIFVGLWLIATVMSFVCAYNGGGELYGLVALFVIGNGLSSIWPFMQFISLYKTKHQVIR